MKTRQVEERYVRLREVAVELGALAGDLEALERTVLDHAILGTGCQRAALVIVSRRGDDPSDLGIDVIRARAIAEGSAGPERGDCEGGSIVDQQGAEFSVVRSLIKECVRRSETVLVRDSLGDPATRGVEVPRSVLCHPFPVGPTRTGVLFLTRSVGEPSFTETDLEWIDDFGLVCLPVLVREMLTIEIERARAAGEAPGAAGGGDGSEVESEGRDPSVLPAGEEIPSFHGIIGRSPRMQALFHLVEKIKDTDFNVCIVGESGTGKELLARAIHASGVRRDREFVSENCGAISESLLESELFGYVKGAFTGADENRKGLFELADGGTLFLDEIGDMSEGMQRKLLRVLQEGVVRPVGSKQLVKVDVRVICASNRDLRQLVESGSFRADLFYRLNVISVEVPPLRERMEDVPLLAQHFMAQIAREEGTRRKLSESAMKALLSYNWPGNIRELMNVLRRVMIMGSKRLVTRKEILPLLSGGPARSYVGEGVESMEDQIVLRIPRRTTFNEIIAECEKAVLLNALKENRWNKSRVTKVLRIPRQSLYNKIARYELKRPERQS